MTLGVLAPTLVTLAAIGIAAGEGVGYSPLSNGGAANAAEAAALGNASDLLRLLALGEAPDQVQTLRPEIISPQVLRATPIEAAIWSRQLILVRLLDQQHVIVGESSRHHLACLARDVQVPDVADYLAPGGVGVCGVEEGLARVLARTAAGDGR